MEIKYKIIEAYPDEHQIVVRYYTNSCPEHTLASHVDENGNMLRCRTDVAINVPIPAPSMPELEALILRCCPHGLFELKNAVMDPNIDTSLSSILPLLNVEVSATLPVAPPPAVTSIADMISFQP